MSNTNRRTLLTAGFAAVAASGHPQQPASTAARLKSPAEPNKGVRQDLDLVKAFVGAGHGNKNIDLAREMLASDPKLVFASWDWGGGDWETALGGAAHTG